MVFRERGVLGPMYRSKKVRYIAVAAPKRVAGFEDVPTVGEAGGPANFEVKAWVAVFAPKGTPQPIIARVNESIGKALSEPDVRERFASFGFEPFVSSPSDIAKLLEADSKTFGDIVKRAKISVE